MGLLDKGILSSILFYYQHEPELKQACVGRYLLFREEVLLGNFASCSDAYRHGYQVLQHPHFFVKYCQ
ncbi:hypothetical protein [Adhaeribacter pallidiroseus]|uniref:Uncharacterized protein n=1 Tax=Adhaeribacter pallidiroseus TaxID=2072847 RepID=A0A369Q5M2_9BACT|nr:hypothetical protein [Adhaeribacter pallidiroseus]RDC58805.1 hypothetical protein AHMF7616_05239 [Adhaeribacter pallidiroseus]